MTPPPRPPATAPSLAEQGAQWIFPSVDFPVGARLDLGDLGTLYAGADGRRAIFKGGVRHDARVPLPASIDGVVGQGGEGVVFATWDGFTYAATDPLGPYVRVHEETTVRASGYVAAGARALVIVDDGAIRRSLDGGRTWSSHPSPLAPPFRFHSIRMDTRGRGLLLALPQRVFVTVDDAATWQDIDTPGIGAKDLSLDRGGGLALVAEDRDATLEVDPPRLTAVDKRAPLALPDAREEERLPSFGAAVPVGTRLFVAEARSNLEAGTSTMWIGVGAAADGWPKLGRAPGLDGCRDAKTAGHGGTFVVACRNDSKTTLVYRSEDAGATFRLDATIDGQSYEGPLVVGPGGYTFVAATTCAARADCTLGYVRAAGATSFAALAAEPHRRVAALAFDEARDRAYIVEDELGDSDVVVAVEVVVSSLASSKGATRVRLGALGNYGGKHVATVDTRGSLVVGVASKLFRMDADGNVAPPRDVSPLSTIAFAGDRGLARSSDKQLWETANAGESWSMVLGPAVQNATCDADACVTTWPRALRVGWDLTADGGGDRRAPSVHRERPGPRWTGGPPHSSPLYVTPVAKNLFDCTTSGASFPVAIKNDLARVDGDPNGYAPETAFMGGADLAKDLRFAIFEATPDERVVARVVRGGGAPTPRTLLGKADAGRAKSILLTEMHYDPDGLIALRYTRAPEDKVDVDVAWLEASTATVHAQRIASVAFDVSPSWPINGGIRRVHATTKILSDGLLFHVGGSSSGKTYLLRNDGQREERAWPPLALGAMPSLGEGLLATRVGAEALVLRFPVPLALAWSAGGGKRWETRTWSFDEGHPLLRDGGAALLYTSDQGRGENRWIFPLGPTPSADPPKDPPRVTLTIDSAPCEDAAWQGFRYDVRARDLTSLLPFVTVDGARREVSQIVARILPDGRSCTTTLISYVDSGLAIISTRDPGGAWVLRQDGLVGGLKHAACVAR